MPVLRTRAGHRPYLIGIAIDITERRALEAQLRQAQKMEAFGQLAGGIAHDFNNILTIILGTCEGLFDALPPQERLRADVKTIADAARRAASMTQQLLAFSRRAIVEPKIVNLSAAVADVGKMIERLIGEDVRLHRELAQDLWPVRVDPGLFTQLLVNLAVNARDAMPAGGSLTVQTRNADLRRPLAGATVPPGRYVVLTVTDTGTGIPPEIRERIFEPFFTTKPVGQGSGLGLAVVDGIVRQSGGQVDVWSEPGRGTSFAIYFPAVDIPVPPPDVGATPDLAGAPRGTETILLVEDEPGVRRLARMVLERLGYRVVEAPNGEAALRRVDTHDEPIDLLVTDVVMPGIDGRQLAEQLRRRCAGLQTLFLSGYTDDAIVRRGIIQDEVAFLRKPFSAAELAGKVRDLLDRAARRPRRGHLS